MFKNIIDAQLPLVAVTTRDVVNLPDVLKKLTGRVPEKFKFQLDDKLVKFGTTPEQGRLYYLVLNTKMPPAVVPFVDEFYSRMVKMESTLLVVNAPYVSDSMFNAGELPVPKDMLEDFMAQVTDSAAVAALLMPSLGGVTIKEAVEYARLTMAEQQSLTAAGLMATRKQYFRSQSGLFLIDPAQDFYEPDAQLVEYVNREHEFFLHEDDVRLRPRGLLFDGPPGVGKTAGAKFIAEKWGVPLYRVDVATTQEMWVGSSERHMQENLDRLDLEEPCVALFDEVEKIFKTSNSDHSTKRAMLSQLLWWLAEHKSRVFVVMTTNKSKDIPPELYRERRIDEKMNFDGLLKGQATLFIEHLMETFGEKIETATALNILKLADDADDPGSNHKTTQSALTQAVFKYVKKNKLAAKLDKPGKLTILPKLPPDSSRRSK